MLRGGLKLYASLARRPFTFCQTNLGCRVIRSWASVNICKVEPVTHDWNWYLERPRLLTSNKQIPGKISGWISTRPRLLLAKSEKGQVHKVRVPAKHFSHSTKLQWAQVVRKCVCYNLSVDASSNGIRAVISQMSNFSLLLMHLLVWTEVRKRNMHGHANSSPHWSQTKCH